MLMCFAGSQFLIEPCFTGYDVNNPMLSEVLASLKGGMPFGPPDDQLTLRCREKGIERRKFANEVTGNIV
jgi:hypothetical protein